MHECRLECGVKVNLVADQLFAPETGMTVAVLVIPLSLALCR